MSGMMRSLLCLVAVAMMVTTGFSPLIKDGAEAKIDTYPMPSLPPTVPHGTEISNANNLMLHLANGDDEGARNDVTAYVEGKLAEKLSPTCAWALWARDVGIMAGNYALSKQAERAANWYTQMRQSGLTPSECQQIIAVGPLGIASLPEKLFQAARQNPLPVDAAKECIDLCLKELQLGLHGMPGEALAIRFVLQHRHLARHLPAPRMGNARDDRHE